MVKLSLVLAVYNEEKNIKDCLLSAKGLADEIIVVDGSSRDKTAVIARKMATKIYVVPNQKMFHKNKQLALEKATGDWILQLDADERISPELKKEILKVINHPLKMRGRQPSVNGYYIPRKNYFLTRFLTKGGQYPDYVIRLVKKGKAYFPCKSVHEQIKVQGGVGYLKNDLIHLANPTFSHYITNVNRYTTLTAKKLMLENISLNFINHCKYLFFLPLKTFLLIYFRHKGFKDGFPGFIFALFSGLHFHLAYIKYWQMKKGNEKINLEKDWNEN